MKRGDVVIVALAGEYGKPRPAVVVQADRFLNDFESILVCPMTSDATAHSVARIPVPHSPNTGLRAQSQIMIDKASAIPKSKVSGVIGRLDAITLERLDWSLSTFLDLK